MKTIEAISAVKIVQFLPSMNLEKRINKLFVDSVNIQNVLSSFKLADIFNLKNPAEHFLRRIEGSFAMLADTKNFLELDYEQVAKILGSSALQIVSEVEIFTVADSWLRHDFVERRKYAKHLLLKVRVKFLSEHALKHIQREKSAFSKAKCSVEMLNKLDENVLKTKSSSYYSRRYCNRDIFMFLTYGGIKNFEPDEFVTDVSMIDGKSFKLLKSLAPLTKTRYASKAVVVKDEIYVFGGRYDNDKPITSLERYSFRRNAWDTVCDIFDHRFSFSACAFIDSVFFIGGKYPGNNVTNTCLKFDTKQKNWKEVSRMHESRHSSASVVFQSNVVVSGGIGDIFVNRGVLRSVETYDVFADKWTPMPNMISGKDNHKLVSLKNKLFVIDCDITNCELYDNHSNKFVIFREPNLFFPQLTQFINVFSIGSKLVFFNNKRKSVFTYGVHENEWCRKYLPYKMACFTCVQVPWL